jgi:Skp family chaperone for outer membrane proteins
MNRLQTTILTSLALLIIVPAVRAQLSTVMVVDFERAVVESAEGKKSSDKFNAALQAKQGELEKRQKELEDLQRKLQTGARTLSDAAKAEIQRDIDRRTTEMQRRNEDAQKEMQILRDELLRPIAERATALLQAMAAEQGYTVVVDLSNQENNVVWYNEKNNITAELIKRIDATTPKEPPKPTGAAPATTTKPPVTTAPKPTTPAPAAPKQ